MLPTAPPKPTKRRLVITIVSGIFAINNPDSVTFMDAVYLGMFSYIIVTVAFIYDKVSKLSDFDSMRSDVRYVTNQTRVKEAITRYGSRSSDLFWGMCLVRAHEGLYALIDSSSFQVSRDQIPHFWQQAVINTDSSWICTNFVNLNEGWRTGWMKRGLEFQKLGIDE